MSAYDELPQDFKDHWFSNLIYETYHWLNLTKHFTKRGHCIIIYDCKYRNENTIIHKILQYNITTQNYEIDSKRFFNYSEALDHLWELDKIDPNEL